MKIVYLYVLSAFFWLNLVLSADSPIKTDYAIFLFDHGDKNMIASMLHYAQEHQPAVLAQLDFRLIFMGASTEALSTEPFCHYADKLIHYKQLGLAETVDHTWMRNRRLSQSSLEKITQQLNVQKKVVVGVSCAIFEQLLEHYQAHTDAEVLALRDNPNPEGDTDYFQVADKVQRSAKQVAVPSKAAAEKLNTLNQRVVIVGHGPIEEYCHQAQAINKQAVIERLGLDAELPLIVYTGVYGESYENSFKLFLDLVPHEKALQILIVPHPRYQGIVEKKICAEAKYGSIPLRIVGDFEPEVTKKIKTVEALAIADIVVTADPTSTVVFQANALKKKVFYVNDRSSAIGENLSAKKLIRHISTAEQFLKVVREIPSTREINSAADQDIFDLLGMPRDGAQLLWEEWLH